MSARLAMSGGTGEAFCGARVGPFQGNRRLSWRPKVPPGARIAQLEGGTAMDQLTTLEYSLGELRAVVASLDEADMATSSNCEPWTVRRLASHALNNQLRWAGVVTGQTLVSVEDTMGAVAIDGDLVPVADEVVQRTVALWRSDGVMDALHVTPFGEAPGHVVINFATVDAIIHAWDLSSSVGRAIEFRPDALAALTAVVAATCTDHARHAGLIKAATQPPADATTTERLVAAAGRSPRR